MRKERAGGTLCVMVGDTKGNAVAVWIGGIDDRCHFLAVDRKGHERTINLCCKGKGLRWLDEACAKTSIHFVNRVIITHGIPSSIDSYIKTIIPIAVVRHARGGRTTLITHSQGE